MSHTEALLAPESHLGRQCLSFGICYSVPSQPTWEIMLNMAAILKVNASSKERQPSSSTVRLLEATSTTSFVMRIPFPFSMMKSSGAS
jgi:hypothetical protein